MANISHVTATLPQGKPATAEELEATKNQPKFEISTVEYAGRKSTIEERMANAQERFKLTVVDAPKQAKGFAQKVHEVSESIEAAIPSLRDKHWDFSIDKNNDFTVSGENLSQDEITAIKSALEESGLKGKLANFRDTVVKAYELERGPELYSNNWARFNLETDTFDKLVQFRELNDQIYNEKKQETYEHNVFNGLSSQISAKGTETYDRYTLITYV